MNSVRKALLAIIATIALTGSLAGCAVVSMGDQQPTPDQNGSYDNYGNYSFNPEY